jgi:hypothetical protein
MRRCTNFTAGIPVRKDEAYKYNVPKIGFNKDFMLFPKKDSHSDIKKYLMIRLEAAHENAQRHRQLLVTVAAYP